MAVVGMWLAIVGYGVAYSGVITLGGGTCGLVQAFQGRCALGARTAAATGSTQQDQLLAQQQQQANMIGTQPISQVA